MAEYIEREVAINALKQNVPWAYHAVAVTLASLVPAADVKPVVRGKWIYQDEAVFGNPYGSYRCDHCGNGMSHKTNYCPLCGADMRGEDNEY